MELSIAYALTGPDGTRVVFGNGDVARLDPDWVGYLDPQNGITGLLDGADVRENAVEIPQGDGGVDGPYYLGRRPGTIQGVVDPNASTTTQETKIAKVKRASRALRADAVLRWTPSTDGIERMLRLRRSGRPSFPGRRPKSFQLAMTSRDAYVLASIESNLDVVPGAAAGELGIADAITDPITSELNVTAQQFVQNAGDAETWPRFRVQGPITNPEILNVTTGKRVRLVYTLAAGEWLDVYPERGVILLGGSADRYSALDFDLSEWWQLVPGLNDVRLLAAAYSAGARVTVYWRHAWE